MNGVDLDPSRVSAVQSRVHTFLIFEQSPDSPRDGTLFTDQDASTARGGGADQDISPLGGGGGCRSPPLRPPPPPPAAGPQGPPGCKGGRRCHKLASLPVRFTPPSLLHTPLSDLLTALQVLKALLAAKEAADAASWQAFQAEVLKLKLQRTRVEREAQEVRTGRGGEED